MKKFNIALTVAAVLMAFDASAQTFDMFNGSRTIVFGAPQNLVAGSNLTTNGPVDHVRLTGRVIVNFTTVTNTGTSGGTLTATLYSSPDQTNLTAIANYALATATVKSYTNSAVGSGTNVYASNTVLLPGTEVTPTVSSGFSTTYLSPAPFTNSGAITLNGNKNVQVSFNVDDQYRYLYVVYTPGGTATNFTVGATITGLEK